jgi:6-phospho-beta-glucosidase
MRALKLAVIGSGSTYTPELINGFITRMGCLKLDSVYLMDIDENKRIIVGNLVKRILKAHGVPARVVFTGSVEEAVEGADYVIGQVRVGRLEARVLDEKIPLKYGLLGQETTGIGGFMKALRTIPVIMNVAKTMERLAPNAWLINFSNPSGLIAQAVLNNSSTKMMGLCNGPIHMIRAIEKTLPEGTKKFDYDFIGLNHLSWVTGIYADGKEILQQKLADLREINSLSNIPEVVYDEQLLRSMKGLPIGYLNYFNFRDEQVKHCIESPKTRGEICMEIEEQLLEMYKDENLTEKPALLDKRGGVLYSEVAVSLIDAIENDRGDEIVVDVKNNGALDFMEKDDVIEIKCRVDKNGAVPIKPTSFDNDYIKGMMRVVKAYERLTVKAGLYGDYNSALAALLVHPLIGDYHKARAAMDEMIEANRNFLPQFNAGLSQ